MLLTYVNCAIVSCVSGSVVRLEFSSSSTSNTPTLPGSGVASSTLAVFPPASDDTNSTGPLTGPSYRLPFSKPFMGGFNKPKPVANTVIVSPGITGLFLVATPALAQHNAAAVAVSNSFAPLLTDAEY